MIDFSVSHEIAAGGRNGILTTPHGVVDTPAFMPVGTYGAVRGVTPAQLREAGVSILLANAYHLALRPGAETISKLGGLHRFMGWNGPILTDSGGYQLFSLSSEVTVNDNGAIFRSHLDGSPFELTPERAVEIQLLLGVDIGMVFDLPTATPADREASARSAERTLAWTRRSRRAAEVCDQTAFFGIMQGGLFEDLRRTHSQAIAELDFPGYAVGGLSVGEDPDETMRVGRFSVGLLPPHKPRYMMGMGKPEDLVALCGWGYDLFDCVIPTRNARNNTVVTSRGTLALRNAAYALDQRPIEEDCQCYTCGSFSRAYLHHLAKRKEMLAAILASVHNIRYYQRLMADIRSALAEDCYTEFSREFAARRSQEDLSKE